MQLREKLNTGQFVAIAEVNPPKGTNTSAMLSTAINVRHIVDAFLIPDMNNAVMRMSALGAAVLFKQRELEPIMQVGCSDRNRIALQADLLAASACGISDVMAVTGDDSKFGDHIEAKSVFDVKLPQLLDMIEQLAGGKDFTGNELDGAPAFCVYSTVVASGEGSEIEDELALFAQKKEKGVSLFFTNPIFSLSSAHAFLEKIGSDRNRLIPNVLLLKSAGMARYLSTHYNAIEIPDDVFSRIQKSKNVARECVDIAAEMVAEIKREGFPGVLVSTLGRDETIPDILRNAD